MSIFRIVFALFFCLVASNAFACSCAGPGAPGDAFAGAQAVFSARVAVSGKNDKGYATGYHMTVDKVWKGNPPREIDYGLPRHGCAYWNFEDGKNYLIYALPSYDKEKPDELHFSMCTRTKPLDKAMIETRYFGGDAKAINNSLPKILLSGETPDLRAEAATLLGELMLRQDSGLPETTVAAILKAAKDESPVVRLAATRTMGMPSMTSAPGRREALITLLKDANREVRSGAVGAFGMMGGGSSDIFRALVDALAVARRDPWPERDRQESLLWGFARAISTAPVTDTEKDEAVDILLALVDEIKNPYSRVGAIQHLGFMKERAKKAAPVFLKVLKDAGSYHLKQYTIIALGDIGASETQSAIEPYLNDENCYVASSTVQAVHKMNPAGFPAFYREKGMPMLKARFDKCAAEFTWGLQSIGPDAREIQPFITEKYNAMPEGDWKKSTLKTLLDMWNNAPQ